MIEIVPQVVDTAFLYFHTRRSTGDELAPFADEFCRELPTTYLWAGDGPIEGGQDDPMMGSTVNCGTSRERYWFVFPMHGRTAEAFASATEAMGAVLATSGGYANALADQVMARFRIPAARVVLCGHQHGACVALAAAMLRRADPFSLAVLFDPWPLETLYLAHEQGLPQTKVLCVDNAWVRAREQQRGAVKPLYEVFREYGINADGITLPAGEGKPYAHMVRAAAQQIKALCAQGPATSRAR